MAKKIDHVGPQKKGKKNTPISKTPKATAEDVCFWNDVKYTSGGKVCFNKKVYRCTKSATGNEWIPTGETCQ
jgi:hypothetical protein